MADLSDLRKIGDAQKARILADAQRQAAEIDRDMETMERLAAKYSLTVGALGDPNQPRPTVNGADKPHPLNQLLANVAEALKVAGDASITRRARVAAEAYIRAKNRPVPLAELDEVLQQNGIKFESDTPRNTLSAVLGQTDSLYSISRDSGWWLKGVPVPELPIARRV